tara:strand:+ start:350 stop:1399 length:1050 start_codon:yes stop_codon:yes gene_type:complete
MKKFILGLLVVSITFGGYFSDNFLKYSTFYTSVSLESPFTPKQKFAVNTQEGTFEETTEEVQGSYNLSLGIRKLARFKYQSKKGNFYDGSENELSDVATLGAVSGWEYLLKWSKLRSFGEEFVDSESWIRYLGDWFVIKGSYANFGREDLEFGQLDIRLRKALGQSWNITLGGSLRGHPAYGLFPFDKWLNDNDGQWWELAYLYGYYDVSYEIDESWSDFNWYDEEGDLVAETDGEFYEYYYGDLIHQYNEDEVDKIGWQYEASAVVGVDFYKYTKNLWLHSWVSVMPFSKGLTPHSFKYGKGDIDHDLGLVAGWKFNRSFGIFGEGRHLSYWGIDSYELKAGLNFTFF